MASVKNLEQKIANLITDDDFLDVVASMLDEAKKGNVSAAKWLADRFWARPTVVDSHQAEKPIKSRRERLIRLAEATIGTDRAIAAG